MNRALALLPLLGGCNLILGVDDFHTRDGGGDIDAGPDADPSSVTGTSMISFIDLEGGVQTAPEDLSVYTIKAYDCRPL